MKRKVLITLAAAIVGILTLTACTSSENTALQGSTTGSAGSQSTVNQSAGGDTSSSGQVSDSQSSGGSSSQTEQYVAAEDTMDAQTQTAQQEEVGEDVVPVGEPVEDGGPVGDVISDEADADAQSEDVWSGTWAGEEESVTISQISDDTITFTFAQSQISGKATVQGSQAVYYGDDYYVVVFNISGDTLEISVSSEEDYDASDSPLNGTYQREGL